MGVKNRLILPSGGADIFVNAKRQRVCEKTSECQTKVLVWIRLLCVALAKYDLI